MTDPPHAQAAVRALPMRRVRTRRLAAADGGAVRIPTSAAAARKADSDPPVRPGGRRSADAPSTVCGPLPGPR